MYFTFIFFNSFLTYPLAGPVRKTVTLKPLFLSKLITLINISGPLINFGILPSPQPIPSFWKEPITSSDLEIPYCLLTIFFFKIFVGLKWSVFTPIGIKQIFFRGTPHFSNLSFTIDDDTTIKLRYLILSKNLLICSSTWIPSSFLPWKKETI